MRALFLALALVPILSCTGTPVADDPVDTDVALPDPGPVEVGYARARIPAPVGIGTVGFGFVGGGSSSSPFAALYPATRFIHGHPEMKVVVISRGEPYDVIFVRLDTVGVFQQIRRELVLRVKEATGRDIDDSLVIGGTHTHSGPGRVVDGGGMFDLIADQFFPEFYDNLLTALTDTIVAAIDDLKPARIGYTLTSNNIAINDRRCEDGDHVNGAIPLIVTERDDAVNVVVSSYPIHGTQLGIDELHLSQDVYGPLEEWTENAIADDTEVLVFNSWGADMSPGSPPITKQTGAVQHGDYERMEEVGYAFAETVADALEGVTWLDDPDIWLKTYRIPIDREHIGYEDDAFPFDYGAVYCTGGGECDEATYVEGLDEACIPFNEEYPAPNQTTFTFGRVGDLTLMTFPGEGGTLLGEAMMAGAREHEGIEDIAFFGYSQDYLGYSILEDDWWLGGYEASGALWGPRQGEYLKDEAIRLFDAFANGTKPDGQADPITPFDETVYEPWVAETALDQGTVGLDVPAGVTWTDIVEFEVAGNDPWLGAPLAYLESADGTPVLRPNGSPVTSDDNVFSVELRADPLYEDVDYPAERTFHWTFRMPVRHQVPGGLDDLIGSYRLRVEIPTDGASMEVLSSVFEVTED